MSNVTPVRYMAMVMAACRLCRVEAAVSAGAALEWWAGAGGRRWQLSACATPLLSGAPLAQRRQRLPLPACLPPSSPTEKDEMGEGR